MLSASVKKHREGKRRRCRHESGGDALRAPLSAEKSEEVVGHGAVDKEGKPQKRSTARNSTRSPGPSEKADTAVKEKSVKEPGDPRFA